jgi:N-acetylglucosaminyldiphosphoundecaprenol N-acetyl-beta-D-mannosaminyltransferase
LNILGVKIDNLTQKEIIEKINSFLTDGKFHQIATVGPEFILEAQKNSEYKEILNNCDLNVADGFGIKLAFWRYGKKLKSRMPGMDLMMEMLKMSEDRELGVFLFCRKDGLSSWKKTKEAILKLCPELIINGMDIAVSHVIARIAKQSRNLLLDEIATVATLPRNDKSVVLCNFGAPYQEIFLNSLKNGMIGVAMGVGGSFDFLNGKVKRAPKIIRQIGLEWLWRLMAQPWEQKGKRLKRIWNAVIIFPRKILWSKQEK